jgi:hypothetical protein
MDVRIVDAQQQRRTERDEMESVRTDTGYTMKATEETCQACLRDLAFSILHQQRTIQEGE